MTDQIIEDQSNAKGVLSSAKTTGVVIGCDVHDWAGFMCGTIFVREETGGRIDFRYGKKSVGEIPKAGSRVRITHSEGVLLEVIRIEILDEKFMSVSDMAEQFHEGISYIAGRPVNSVIMVIGFLCGGLCIVLFGILKSWTYPLALSIYGVVGLAEIAMGILLWDHLGDC